MYKLCKTEQSAARQRELELELLKAMTNHRFEEITISDLCDRIGIPRKSFYRYFSGKEGALYALVDHTLLDFETRFAIADAKEIRTFHQGLDRFFQFWYDQKVLLDALARSGLSGVLIERAVNSAIQDDSMTNRFLSPELYELRAQATMFGVCGLMSMVITWHHDGYPQKPAKMAKLAAQLMTQPLFSEKSE